MLHDIKWSRTALHRTAHAPGVCVCVRVRWQCSPYSVTVQSERHSLRRSQRIREVSMCKVQFGIFNSIYRKPNQGEISTPVFHVGPIPNSFLESIPGSEQRSSLFCVDEMKPAPRRCPECRLKVFVCKTHSTVWIVLAVSSVSSKAAPPPPPPPASLALLFPPPCSGLNPTDLGIADGSPNVEHKLVWEREVAERLV